MKKPFAGVFAIALATLSVHQLQAQSKFAKYEVPARIRAVDWLLLQANLRLMRDIDTLSAQDRDKVEVPLWVYESIRKDSRFCSRV